LSVPECDGTYPPSTLSLSPCEGIGSFAILDNGFKNLKNPGASNRGERGHILPISMVNYPAQGMRMDEKFWHQRWENNEIAFHEGKANALLVKHFNEFSLLKGRRVFVPLCGKTLDISWLLSNGYRVAGAELSQLAIEQLFMDLGLQPEISTTGAVEQWSAHNLDIFIGDIFAVSKKMLGPVDAVYDRAALVALPEEMRARYAPHLMEIAGKAPQLLICYEYDQRVIEGPPFSISNEEVTRHYARTYEVRLVASTDVPGGLKSKCAAKENVWLLKGK
jgi:thiopurine S-methyltransferase